MVSRAAGLTAGLAVLLGLALPASAAQAQAEAAGTAGTTGTAAQAAEWWAAGSQAPRTVPQPVPQSVAQSAPAANATAAIKYAVSHGATVISLPPGPPSASETWCDPALQAAVSAALARDVVVVTGAGDANLTGKNPVEPASCPGVLAVGGTGPGGQPWPYSTRAAYVSVAAPVTSPVTVERAPAAGAGTRPQAQTQAQTQPQASTGYASAAVAAVAAQIRARYPKLRWYQVDQRIIATANRVPPAEDNDYGFAYGAGVLDTARAVNAARYPVPASAPNPPYTRYVAWLNTMGGQSWARANGVTVPSSGPTVNSAAGLSSPTALLARNRVAAVAIAVIVVLLLAASALLLVLRARSTRLRRASRAPGDEEEALIRSA